MTAEQERDVALTGGPQATVGFVGLGRMGLPMSRQLVAAGYGLVVYDTDVAALERAVAEVPALQRAESLAEVASPVTILMLPDSEAVTVVIDGGLLDALPPGSTVIDMGSSEPTRTKESAERLASLGHRLLDAPVSGGVAAAEAGSLTIMVGGTAADVADVWPVLGALGERVVHAGPVGAGHAVKALNNAMSATHLLATCEALRVAIEFGLDPGVVVEIVNASSGRSGSTENKWPLFIATGTFDSGFGLPLMAKDTRIAAALAESLDSPAPLLNTVASLWSTAASRLGSADHTEIARWLDQLAAKPTIATGV